mgnify:CR=1 FL=1
MYADGIFCIWNAHLEKESRKRGIFLRQQKWYEKALMLILFTLTYIVAGQMELCWIGVLGVRITQIQQEKGQFFMAMGEFLMGSSEDAVYYRYVWN